MKILALILCLCAIFALTSCDMLIDYVEQYLPLEDTNIENDKSNENADTDGTIGNSDAIELPITSSQWDEAIAIENFSNITFAIEVRYPDKEPYPILCKIDGDRAAYSEGSYAEEIVDKETRDAIYTIYISTVLSIVESFDNFTYDAKSGLFTSDDDIVYNVTVMDYDATITASNTKVKVDTDKNIAEISCGMKHEFIENGKPDSLEFDVVFSFYNYGTTVVGA